MWYICVYNLNLNQLYQQSGSDSNWLPNIGCHFPWVVDVMLFMSKSKYAFLISSPISFDTAASADTLQLFMTNFHERN